MEFSKIQEDTLVQSNNVVDTLNKNITYRSSNYNAQLHDLIINQNKRETNQLNYASTDTLNIKPEFCSIDLNNKSLIDSYSNSILVESSNESNCFIVYKTKSKGLRPVLYNHTETVKSLNKEIYVKEKDNQNNDWLLVPMLLGSIIFASVIILFRKYIVLFFEALIYGNQSNRLINEKNTQIKRLSWLLDLIFIISFSILVDQIFEKFNIYSPPQRFKFLIFIISFSFLVLLKSYHWIIYKLTAAFSNQKKFISDLYDSSSLYTRCLGFFLLPLVFLISYSSTILPTIFIYLSIILVLISLIFRAIRMIRLFVGSGFSIFYFILYLCALEIAPLLLAYKGVVSINYEGS